MAKQPTRTAVPAGRKRVAFVAAASAVAALAFGGDASAITSRGEVAGSAAKVSASDPLPAPVAYGSTTALPPWPAPADATAGARAAGLEVSEMEGTAIHFHTHLDVIVDGEPVQVPANLGIDPETRMMSELHTHDTRGVLHIEGPAERRYILGQLFNEWGVRLNSRGIGGLKAGEGKTLTAYVDGERVSGDPASIELTAHREIALVYGDPDEQVDVPSSYDFAPGE
ncbi:hypothetical protein [Streptomyces chattanoogensis]|uniref:hypothetical protein n=1 Tax=Streptomyces chattanoogensis TaxID=66876 RepID=UPI0005D87338|nr:hypothetical protein T261_3855 [Streptomyces lydicus]